MTPAEQYMAVFIQPVDVSQKKLRGEYGLLGELFKEDEGFIVGKACLKDSVFDPEKGARPSMSNGQYML